MQELQHTHFTPMPGGRQVQSKRSLLPIYFSRMQFCAGFAAIGNKNNKVRPGFKRQGA